MSFQQFRKFLFDNQFILFSFYFFFVLQTETLKIISIRLKAVFNFCDLRLVGKIEKSRRKKEVNERNTKIYRKIFVSQGN